MQKAYERINWQNEPSTETALGAENLNKVDKALDMIDDRVINLYGYESRVAESERNAKTSETNAKTSETNAKQSELLAKEYAEHAFSGTPEGYEQIVDTVQKMDIKESADTTLLDSKDGGYKLLSMTGASVQNGTPSIDAPQSINNVGDCVEMITGSFAGATGIYAYDTTKIVNKHPITCTSGDVVKIETENTVYAMYLFYYNESGYMGYLNSSLNVNSHSFTIPSGATYFNFRIDNTTLDTVGKITLTINGLYVVQFVEHGKNFVSFNDVTMASAGYVYNGARLTNTLPIGIYTFSMKHNIPSTTGWWVQLINSETGYISRTISGDRNGAHTSASFVLTEPCDQIKMYVNGACTISDIQIEAGEVATDYEEYKETVATVLLDAPLCETDVMDRTEVVRKRASVVFDGSETWYMGNGYFYIKVENGAYTKNVLSTHYKNDNSLSTTNNGNIWINTASQLIVVDTRFTSVGDFKTWLQSNPITVEYELETPYVEALRDDAQIALNSLETFDSVTYINVDSRTQPKGIKGEYGTSKVGARTIKNELRNDTLEIKYNELAVALVATESGV